MKNISLIGISGKMGSRKDTVARIIQILHVNPRFSNKKIATMLEQPSYTLTGVICSRKNPWLNRKFASKLKEAAWIITGIPIHKFESRAFKKTNMGPEWDTYGITRGTGKRQVALQSTPHDKDNIWLKTGERTVVHNQMTVRDLLQKLGTEALRDNLHPDVWVNALFSDPGFAAEKWLVTDVRFVNEAEAIKERGGILMRVKRDLETGSHASETQLDKYKFDVVIKNNGNLEELVESVRKFCKKQKFI